MHSSWPRDSEQPSVGDALDGDKENVTNGTTAPSCLRIARENTAAEPISTQPRPPLAERNPADYYPEGYDAQSVYGVVNLCEEDCDCELREYTAMAAATGQRQLRRDCCDCCYGRRMRRPPGLGHAFHNPRRLFRRATPRRRLRPQSTWPTGSQKQRRLHPRYIILGRGSRGLVESVCLP